MILTGSDLLIGIISGIVASCIFFLTLLLVRPRIKISSEICREVNRLYRVKVLNLTRAMLTNVRYTLHHVERSGDGNFYTTDIQPHKKELFFIDKYSRNDEDASYAVGLSK